MKKLLSIFLFSILFLAVSCSWSEKNENNLSAKDLSFIRSLGILHTNEKILLFESNGGISGLKQSGNFVTDKRVASYWIENNLTEKNFAFYSQIDSMKLNNKTTAVTLASSISIYKHDNTTFEIYVDVDSSRLNQFYNQTVQLWEKNK
jgi:hypothetical protein